MVSRFLNNQMNTSNVGQGDMWGTAVKHRCKYEVDSLGLALIEELTQIHKGIF